LLSTRPWSFTASAIPVLLAYSLVREKVSSFLDVIWVVSVIVCAHAASNLTNTYCDYMKGVDNKKTDGDRALVDGQCEPKGILILSCSLYLIAIALYIPRAVMTFSDSGINSMTYLFIAGIILGFAYTAQPLRLKYHALGDLTILLIFGPIIQQFAVVMFTGSP